MPDSGCGRNQSVLLRGWQARLLVQVLLCVLAGVQGPYIGTRLNLNPRRRVERLAFKVWHWISTPCSEMKSQTALTLTLDLV